MEFPIIKILLPATVAFIIGILITPIITHYLYTFKVWKKQGGKTTLTGSEAVEFNRLKAADEIKTPRMGGIVIWGSVILTVFTLWLATIVTPDSPVADMFFLSRSQTWIPFAALLVGAVIGFLNDYYDVAHAGKGLRLKTRLIIITALATAIGWWFYAKLGVTAVGVPFSQPFEVGLFIIPIFVFIALAVYASGVIDGIDGLSGGVFTAIFLSYAGVAFSQNQYDIAAFCATVAGAVLAFLWFNIPPARFWMTETGTMSLTLALSVIVFMTDDLGDGHGIALLPIIGFPLVATVISNVLQITYRKCTGKKLFKIAPLHHHFEAIGWPSTKVTMRYWIISIMCGVIGLAIAMIS